MGSQFLYARYPYLLSAPVDFTTTGDNTLVAAVAAKRINIHRLWLVVGGATNLTFKNGASTSFSGSVPMATNGGMTFDTTGEPWFSTSLGNAFILNQSGSVQISGMIYYSIDI